MFEDRMHIINDLAAGHGNIRVAIEADEDGASGERVVGVARITDGRSGVDGGTALERRAGLDVVIQGGVVVLVRKRVRRGARRRTMRAPWLGFGFRFGTVLVMAPLWHLPTLCDRWRSDIGWSDRVPWRSGKTKMR